MNQKIITKIILLAALVGSSSYESKAQAPYNWTAANGFNDNYTGTPLYQDRDQAVSATYLTNESVIAGTKYVDHVNWNNSLSVEKYNSSGGSVATYDFPNVSTYYSDYSKQVSSYPATNDVYVLGRIYFDATWLDDAVLIKLNSSLVFQWARYFYGSAGVSETPGCFYIDTAGYPYTANIIDNPGSSSGKKISVSKIDKANGNALWTYEFTDVAATGDINSVTNIKTDNAGNVYICGSVISTTQSNRYFTAKVNATGTLGWKKYFDGQTGLYYDAAKALIIDKNQNILVTGESYKSVNDLDIVTIKYSPTGSVLWNKRKHIGTGANGGSFVRSDNSNNVYVAGYYYSSATNKNNTAIIKYDENGVQVWVKQYTNFTANAFRVSSSGVSYAVGTKNFFNSGTYTKAHIKKISSAGVLQWTYTDPTVPGSGGLLGYKSGYNDVVLKAADQVAIAPGYYTTFYDNLVTVGWRTDNFYPTVRISDNNEVDLNSAITLSPNPVNSQMQLLFSSDFENAQLTVLDVQGREVMNKKLQNNAELIDVSKLTPGIYVAQIVYDGNVVTKKFVKE